MMSAAVQPNLGIAGVVHKPFGFDRLPDLVARLIGPAEPTRDA